MQSWGSVNLDVRDEFPCLEQRVHGHPLTYLDSAATALKPACVLEALQQYYALNSANVHRGVHALSERATSAFESARETVRTHVNAGSSREIIFTSGATDAINLVARSYGDAHLAAGDEILMTAMEHHSNIVPWQLLRERTGVVLKMVPMTPEGDVDLDAYAELLGPRTKLVAVTALSNALGTVNPVAQLVARAHDVGARVLVDAAQALAMQPCDVQALDCDFLVFSGHKVFGPNGIGVLYGREALLAEMPPFRGGGDMILSVTLDETVYNELPYRFEAGTPHVAGAIGLAHALLFVQRLGYAEIAEHEAVLLKAAQDQLAAMNGVRMVGRPQHRSGILTFVVDGIHPHDIGTVLDGEGVAVRTGHHCAQPAMAHFGLPATVRASFSVYNDMEDVKRLVTAVARAQEVFG